MLTAGLTVELAEFLLRRGRQCLVLRWLQVYLRATCIAFLFPSAFLAVFLAMPAILL